MKLYYVDLNADAKEKWREIIEDNLDAIKSIYKKLEAEYSGVLGTMASYMVSLASTFGYVLYTDEISYIAKKCDIPFGKVVLLQIMYELSASCTSVIYYDENIKAPVHFRTMDWALPDLKKMTIRVEFQRDKKTVYTAVTWAGYVGVLTAMKSGEFSVALNYRSTGGSIVDNLKNLVKSNWPGGYLIRYVMESKLSCTDVIATLCKSTLVAPCYFTICGSDVDTCTVIIRDRNKYTLNKMSNNRIVQTNIDPDDDNRNNNILYSIERTKLANSVIDYIIDEKIVYDKACENFSKFPIINSETIYMCTFVPKTGYYNVKTAK